MKKKYNLKNKTHKLKKKYTQRNKETKLNNNKNKKTMLPLAASH